jgi:signal transduction histidine kinase/CheY-like chemotaxis protein
MSKLKLTDIPFKIITGYLIILAVITFAGIKLFSENALFFKIDADSIHEESKLTTLSNLQHKIARVERFARNTVYSTNSDDIILLNQRIDSLIVDIDYTKEELTQFKEVNLLDVVISLLKQKSANVTSLQQLREKQDAEKDVNFAITNLKQLEEQYRKLKIEDFVKEPNKLGKYERNVINDFVSYLNKNIPDDDTNTISQRQMDSILVSSKNLLNKVKVSNEEKRKKYEAEEKKLLSNEKEISEKIQVIFSTVEKAIIKQNVDEQQLKEKRFKKLNTQISIFATIAFTTTIIFMVLNIIDFIKSQRYKRELEIANDKSNYLLKSREQLISTVSHDLKSPIAAISGYGDILAKTNLNEKQSYYISNIIKSAGYLTNLANDLASLTLIEAGKIKLEKSPFSLNQLLIDTAQNIQSIYPNKPIQLIYDLEEVLENNIVTDPYRVRQIATNLIGNAYKFTTEGSITIGSKLEKNNQVSFYVKDTGIGIKKENLDAVFREFTQADDTIEKRFGGTGLGLTISTKIAEILGGSIQLKSEFGKGSCFTVWITYDELTEKVKTNIATITINATNKSLKAMIVDDDEQIITLLKEILQRENIEVYDYNNVAHLLKEVNIVNPDFIFTDIQMPESTGFDLVKMVKNNDNTKHIPVIALTGNTDAEKIKYQQAGFNALLSKPFSINSITNTINKLIAEPNTFIINNKHLDAKPVAYNLNTIAEFLNNDNQLILEFLEKSRTNNQIYLSDLKQFYKNKDSQAIKTMAHKMSSIFKQLEHKEITSLLKVIESETDDKKLNKHIKILETRITTFFDEVIKNMG